MKRSGFVVLSLGMILLSGCLSTGRAGLSSTGSSAIPEDLGVSWGMTVNEIIHVEGRQPDFSNLPYMRYQHSWYGFPSEVQYVAGANGLEDVSIIFTERYDDLEMYLGTFAVVQGNLEKELGKPSQEAVYKSEFGEYIGRMLYIWEVDTTLVMHELLERPDGLTHSIHYTPGL